jgi:hypothetical protein
MNNIFNFPVLKKTSRIDDVQKAVDCFINCVEYTSPCVEIVRHEDKRGNRVRMFVNGILIASRTDKGESLKLQTFIDTAHSDILCTLYLHYLLLSVMRKASIYNKVTH